MKNKLVYIVLFVGFCVNMFACSDGKGEALLPEPIPILLLCQNTLCRQEN